MNTFNSLKRFSLSTTDAAANIDVPTVNAWRQPQSHNNLEHNSLGEGAFYPSDTASSQPHSPSVSLIDGDNTEDGNRDIDSNGSDQGLNPGSRISSDLGNNSCDLIIAKLSDYQDGELDHEEIRRISAHLGKCLRCSGIFAVMQETDEILEREWRHSAPLPSSLRYAHSIDSIMNSLSPLPDLDIDISLASRHVSRHAPPFDTPAST